MAKIVPEVKGLSLLFLLHFKHDPTGFLKINQKVYGDIFKKNFLGFENYIVNHPVYAERILSSNQNNYFKHPLVINNFKDFIGYDNLFVSTNTKKWKKDRNVAKVSFDANIYYQQYTKVITRKCNELFDSWKQSNNQEAFSVPIGHELDKLVLTIINETLLYKLNLNVNEFVKHLPVIFNAIRDKATSITKIPYLIPTRKRMVYNNEVAYINGIANQLINHRLDDDIDYDDIIGNFLHIYPIDPQIANNSQTIINHLMTFNIIGFSTTTATLRSLLLKLTEAGTALTLMSEEIEKICNGRRPTYEDFTKLKLTQSFVNEVLRDSPPIVFLMRQAQDEDEINGYHIPAKGSFFINIDALHHNNDLWPEPNKFDIERFLKPLGREYQFAFIPFGAGNRNCIARHYSFLTLCLMLVMLIQRFHFALPKDFKLKWTYIASAFHRPNIETLWLKNKE